MFLETQLVAKEDPHVKNSQDPNCDNRGSKDEPSQGSSPNYIRKLTNLCHKRMSSGCATSDVYLENVSQLLNDVNILQDLLVLCSPVDNTVPDLVGNCHHLLKQLHLLVGVLWKICGHLQVHTHTHPPTHTHTHTHPPTHTHTHREREYIPSVLRPCVQLLHILCEPTERGRAALKRCVLLFVPHKHVPLHDEVEDHKLFQ